MITALLQNNGNCICQRCFLEMLLTAIRKDMIVLLVRTWCKLMLQLLGPIANIATTWLEGKKEKLKPNNN